MGKIVSVNPATEEIYGELEEASDSEIAEKVGNARRDRRWKEIDLNKRAEIISGLIKLLERNKEKLARVMAEEMGKSLKEGRHEVDIAIRRVADFCRMIPGFIADDVLFESLDEKNVAVYEPVGSVAVISPWNAPIFLPLAMIVPALLCGNNVIWKPSKHTAFCGLKLGSLFDELKRNGLPDFAFQFIVGGENVGRKLVESDVNMIALTGSARAGKEVMSSAGRDLKRVVLELGGKDPAIVLNDSDLDKAAAAIVKSSTMYTGQVCFAVERVYCLEEVYDKFVSKCVEETKKLRVGDPLDEEKDVGPFAAKFQRDLVLEHVKDAIVKGAKILCGGHEIGGKGYFFAPGVIVNVNHSMKIMKEETFGPITCIMKVSGEDEAIELANDSEYGLTASVWTSDLKRGELIARRLEAGTVEINRHGMSKAGCPWGGYKKSGIGRIYSKEGIREFCNVKHVWVVRS